MKNLSYYWKAVAALSLSAGLFLTAGARAETLSISCGSVGQELEFCRQGVEAWAKKTGHEVKVVSTPPSATERLALYQQIMAAQSGDIDVYQIDVVWPGLLSNHLIPLGSYFTQEELEQFFPSMLANNTVQGQVIALPWFTDAGLLYYRKDLLEKYNKPVPQTWQELTATAREIQDKERAAGNDKMWGFVFQGKAYEGLTCNALEWIDSFGGGQIVDADGKVTINNPQALAALEWVSGLVGTIAPDGVTNYQEEEARGVFQSGNAVFMRNWPYAWALSQAADSAVKDKVGVAALPKGGADGKQTGTLGGWQLAVSKYSKNPDLSADLVKYLTSPEEQKRRAIGGSYNPTLMSLYQDADVLKANPFMGQLYDTFANAVARPSKATGNKYNQVSAEFFGAVQSVMNKQATPKDALAKLEERLVRLSRKGKW